MENIDIYSDLSQVGEEDEVKEIMSNIGRGGRYVSAGDIEIEDDGKMEPASVGFQEKRIRREIANSNERRRMQSINAGFSSLRSLLPHHEGEKLSKAAILQQTAEYIYSLEQEKTRLLSQNCQLKRLLGQTQHMVESDETDSGPAPKRRLIDTGQKLLFDDENDELAEIQNKYDRERRTRMLLEEKVRALESQVYPAGRKILEKFTIDDRVEIIDGTEYQTILTPGAKKQGGMETLVLQAGDRLPSIIQCAMKDVNKVEVEHLPRLTEFSQDGTQAVEIANVQDPVTGATRQYILTQMGDNTSKQNLETIVEAIRHLEGDHLFSEESGPHQYVERYEPCFSEETGPHQVVKEEVVESTISLNDDSTMVEMTLPSLNSLPSITTLPHIPMSLGNISLPTVPVSFTLTTTGNAGSMALLPQVPVSISHLDSITKLPVVSSIQHLELSQLPVVSGMGKLTGLTSLNHLGNPTSILSTDTIELPNIGPPQTSPVNLELAGGGELGEGGEVEGGEAGGSMTPTSDVSGTEHQDHISNSPPQSSPVNLAQSQSADH